MPHSGSTRALNPNVLLTRSGANCPLAAGTIKHSASQNHCPMNHCPTQDNTRKHGLRQATAILFIALATQIHATVRTVSNYTNHPAQYTSLQTAINDAGAGDTILVTGSNTSYGTINVNKHVVIIGAGHNNGNQPTQTSTITLSSGCSNARLHGLLISSITFGQGAATSGIVIERCRITLGLSQGSAGMDGLTIRNCIISASGGGLAISPGSNNVRIENNIIFGTTAFNSNNATNLIIAHNLFLNSGQSAALNSINSAIISDNIFWGRTPVDATVNYCTFNNNITYQTANNTIPFGTNVGANNQVGVAPVFLNAPTQALVLTYDYRVQAGSSGDNAGSDGTDIGVGGGAYPLESMTGRARIPLVTTLNILNSSIGQGGSLNVQVSGTKVD